MPDFLVGDDKDTAVRLDSALSLAKPDLQLRDAYYETRQVVKFLGVTLPEQMRELMVVVGTCNMVVSALEERLDVEGFRTRNQASDETMMWDWWQANDLDEESVLAHQDALALGRAYLCNGVNEDGSPLITVESPMEMIHETNPRTRRPWAAWRRWSQPYSFATQGKGEYATLYLGGRTLQLSQGERGAWVVDDTDPHGLPVMVTPMVYRRRLHGPLGRSYIDEAMGLTDAICRAVTNAQAATELLAAPTRYALGVKREDMKDGKGNQLTPWQFYLGAIWTTANENAKVGQFTAADLRNFDTIISTYHRLLAGLYGLPLRYFGADTANPPSAEGIRADEARLVKQAERQQRAFGGAWERAMRLSALTAGDDDPRYASLETRWRNAATPTEAQTTDAVTKLWASGRYPTKAGYEDMGISDVRIGELLAQLKAEQEDPLFAALGRAPAADPQPAQDPTAGHAPDVTDAAAAPVG